MQSIIYQFHFSNVFFISYIVYKIFDYVKKFISIIIIIISCDFYFSIAGNRIKQKNYTIIKAS